MSALSESLTVRILGDSSHLQRVLEAVGRQIEQFRARFAAINDSPQVFDRLASRLGTGLQQVEARLSRISRQIGLINRLPIRLNTAPAQASLATLSRQIDLIAAKLQLLSLPPLGGRIAAPRLPGLPIQRFAHGGIVRGTTGIDRVPAWLTAGEFVVRKPIVQSLGVEFLNSLNHSRSQSEWTNADRNAPSPLPTAAPSQTVTQFGDISIHVRQPGDIHSIIRDLRLHGSRLRNRRG